MGVSAKVKVEAKAKVEEKENVENATKGDFKKPTPPVALAPATPMKIVKLNPKQLKDGLEAFTKVLELREKEVEKKDLFAASGVGVKLQLSVSGIKLPKESEAQVVRLPLPHHHTAEDRSVCIIVKDLEKGIRPDHEDTIAHFTSFLAEKGVKGIARVISLRELKVEYKVFEAKTQLCHMYDHFLADARIIRLLPKFLGKPFYKRKKFPVQVNLLAKDLPSEISKALHSALLPLSNKGSCSTLTFGLTTMTKPQQLENLSEAISGLEKKYPGGWMNIRSVHLASGTNSLPLYVSIRPSKEVGMVSGLKRKRKEAVEDELSTVVGARVIVTPTGVVKVKRTRDPEWPEDDEKGDFSDKVEEDKTDTDAKEKPEEKTSKKPKKGSKKRKVEADDDSEDEMEDKELAYMQKVADEEEEMEKNIDENEKKLTEKLASKDEESEEEEDVDDKAEAENLLSEGEDSESDDELIMKPKVNDDEDEDVSPAKKSKKGKTGKAKAQKPKSPKEKPATKKSLKQKKFVDSKVKALGFKGGKVKSKK